MTTREPDKSCFRCGELCFGYLCNTCRKEKVGTRPGVIRKLHEEKREKLILCEVR